MLDSALKPNDLVLFADAYDVLIQSTEQEIRASRFEPDFSTQCKIYDPQAHGPSNC